MYIFIYIYIKIYIYLLVYVYIYTYANQNNDLNPYLDRHRLSQSMETSIFVSGVNISKSKFLNLDICRSLELSICILKSKYMCLRNLEIEKILK